MIRQIIKKVAESFRYKETRPALGRWSLDHTESMIYRKDTIPHFRWYKKVDQPQFF